MNWLSLFLAAFGAYSHLAAAQTAYTCFGGARCDGSPVTGTPQQIVCGGDFKTWSCTSSGWQSLGTSCTCVAPIPVYANDNIQSLVEKAPGGTQFVIKAGVHSKQTILPKDNDIFTGDIGAILDGQNVTSYAFIYDDSLRHPSNVIIQGLTIQNYLTPNQRGAILGNNTLNWQVRNNEIAANSWGGINCGPGMQILGNYVHDNGGVGISGYMATEVLIDGNEIAYNNTSRTDPNTASGSSAGIKIFQSAGVTVRNNNVHDNYYAPGIWFDTDNSAAVIDNNYIWNNGWAGIFMEISLGGVVKNNLIIGNGIGYGSGTPWIAGAGIFLSTSSNVEVHHNTVWYNQNGITGVEQNRGAGAQGTWYLQNNYIHDNTITLFSGSTGFEAVNGDTAIFSQRHNRFQGNTYELPSNSYPFEWAGYWMNQAQWQSIGNDVTGIFKY